MAHLTISNDQQLKFEVDFNSDAKRNSGNRPGKVNDNRLLPDERKLTTSQAKHKQCLECKNTQNAGYHGTDLMALVSIFITVT